MSIMKDYEKLKKEIGIEKYRAIDKYIQKFGKVEIWKKKSREIRNIENVNEWEKQYSLLHQKCKPIFVEDVVMDKDEWSKFERWYEQYRQKVKKEREAR